MLAAAVRSNAALLVTFNLADFSPESVDPYRIELSQPDSFLLDQLALQPGRTVNAVLEIMDDYRNPPTNPARYLVRLAKSGIPQFAE